MTFISATLPSRIASRYCPYSFLSGAASRSTLRGVDESHPVGDLFQAGDLQPLALLDDLDEVGRLQERLVGAGVQPGHAAAEDLAAELAAAEILAVHVGDLVLAPLRRLQVAGDVEHLVVVEIEADDGVVRPRMRRLLLDVDHPAVAVELGHAVALGVLDVIAEDRRPVAAGGRPSGGVRSGRGRGRCCRPGRGRRRRPR